MWEVGSCRRDVVVKDLRRVGATLISFSTSVPDNDTGFAMADHAEVSDAFAEHRQFLWDLSYRITGSSVDADALLRECFTGAVASPPPDRDAVWLGRLTTIAARLAVATLRHRGHREYPGSWLPSPVETGDAASRTGRPDSSNGSSRPRESDRCVSDALGPRGPGRRIYGVSPSDRAVGRGKNTRPCNRGRRAALCAPRGLRASYDQIHVPAHPEVRNEPRMCCSNACRISRTAMAEASRR